MANGIHSKKSLTRDLASGAAVLAVAAAFIFGGCAKKTDTTMVDSTTSTSMADTTHANNTATTTVDSSHNNATMSDANILALMGESDSAEITEAKAVVAKTKNAEVKGFANMMIADHTKMKKDGEALSKKINTPPQPPANDPVPGDLTSSLSAINSNTGMGLDSMYINHAVDDHQKDLTMLQDWQGKAQNADLKAAIGKAMPIVQKHLDKAKSIQSMLMKSGGAKASTMQKK